MKVKFAVLLFCVALLLLPVQAFASEDVSSDLDTLTNHIKSSGLNSDWEVIALSKAGKLTDSERAAYLNTINDRLNAKQLSGTDLDKTAMVVKALGQDPTDYQNHNLIKAIYSDASIKSLMDFTYALTALSTDDYTIPSDALWTQDQLIASLVKLQTSSGGWGWAGDPNGDPDVDTTGMVLTALSHYQDKAKDPIDKGISYLKNSEQADGGFVNYSPNSNSTAQVIIALSSLGIDPTEGDFNKNGHTPVTSLDQYKSNGGYKWASFSESDDPFSNEQVIQGLVAYTLFKEGDQLFNFRVKEPVSDSSASEAVTESNGGVASGTNQAPDSISPTNTLSTEPSNLASNTKTTDTAVTKQKRSSDEKNTAEGTATKETKSTIRHASPSKGGSKSSAHRPESQHQVKSVSKQSPERVTTVTKTTQINPLHLYLGSALVLLGIIGIYVRIRLGGVRYEDR
ncbi:prenyltransferase/squalene oxidase repeat-containing protein [Sporolactobacillus laevolacticus]|uniref:prenyltransferase/squalene oxidase repeat-containing protein n=1 Tax=Sporolactobacillus laevolacticus TaxID=33018 RepID=UPI0025B33309|nr:prenyltransferase/squalene oxidase repeat-containing protein [Sporolactobacillus laevolacticus]MDN3954806.1 terpene cyclase/mutase family protein [Sporolactobacillus laevolacticus]